MREHPKLLTGEMVRAVLEDRKTQTREINKTIPEGCEMCPVSVALDVASPSGYSWFSDMYGTHHIKPKYQIGDLLYVREKFSISTESHGSDGHYNMTYAADGYVDEIDYSEIDMGRLKPGKTYPCIHMPKWASRLWLEITDVRIEQLQKISEEDTLLEGIRRVWDGHKWWYRNYDESAKGDFTGYDGQRESFRTLWDSLYKQRNNGWDINPWVWRLEFKKVKK